LTGGPLVKLTNKQARHLVLHLQGLTLPPHLKQSPDELYALIIRLGFVQVDSIQWVERAQHMILHARNQTYRPKDLKRMIEKDRLLFEGWTHDASIIPCEFYPYWRHRFERQEQRLRRNFAKWQRSNCLDQCDQLLRMINEHGTLRSRDLERPKRKGPQKMWQWHDGKAALEFLWRTGKLAITARDGFQKVYDLSENAIAPNNYHGRCDHDAFVDWACRSALEKLGFGSPADIARFWDHISIDEVKDWLSCQTEQSVTTVEIETADGSRPRELFARGDIENLVAGLDKLPERLRALSPFDPVIRDRNRLQWLFNFDYRIEIYVPEAKRKYGYYVYPLLERDRLVGRIDMRANRPEDALQVKKLWLEPRVSFSQARKARLASELTRQARFAGVGQIEWLEQYEH
jgi:uncharacterized protein YcaQ